MGKRKNVRQSVSTVVSVSRPMRETVTISAPPLEVESVSIESVAGTIFGEVYGILPPPPSVLSKARRQQTSTPVISVPIEPEPEPENTAPAYVRPIARVMDPEELTDEDRARLAKLVAKGKAINDNKVVSDLSSNSNGSANGSTVVSANVVESKGEGK